MSEKISRRELIQKSLLGFGALSIPVAFTGCNDGSDDESPEISRFSSWCRKRGPTTR